MTFARPPRSAFPRLAAAILSLVLAGAAHAVPPLVEHDVVLLLKGDVIAQRVDGGPDAMAGYLKALGANVTEAMRTHPQQIPAAGFIVVAVRPDNRTHTWFDFKPQLADATAAALAQAVQSTTPPLPVKTGQVVFALRVSLWSDKPPQAYAPAPQEWKDAAKAAGFKPSVDALVDMVWPH